MKQNTQRELDRVDIVRKVLSGLVNERTWNLEEVRALGERVDNLRLK